LSRCCEGSRIAAGLSRARLDGSHVACFGPMRECALASPAQQVVGRNFPAVRPAASPPFSGFAGAPATRKMVDSFVEPV
jgi:hypothetical protein